MGTDSNDAGETVIMMRVPYAEVVTYTKDLRSLTRGSGSYTLELEGYDPAPADVTKRLVEAYQAAEPPATSKLSDEIKNAARKGAFLSWGTGHRDGVSLLRLRVRCQPLLGWRGVAAAHLVAVLGMRARALAAGVGAHEAAVVAAQGAGRTSAVRSSPHFLHKSGAPAVTSVRSKMVQVPQEGHFPDFLARAGFPHSGLHIQHPPGMTAVLSVVGR